ncbi:hypothetical protein [Citrobacter werkmanii]|uniref:hypothetical protein n=1 Tax=Citrobacter werkmanii TaxID=67827 RepID=UPI0037C95551
MKRALFTLLLVASTSAVANQAKPVCDQAVEMAFDFVAKQYSIRPDVGSAPIRSVSRAQTYREVCHVGYKQGKKHDRSQLDALMKEVREEANGIDMELREVRELIGDMSVVLAYKAGYQAGE